MPQQRRRVQASCRDVSEDENESRSKRARVSKTQSSDSLEVRGAGSNFGQSGVVMKSQPVTTSQKQHTSSGRSKTALTKSNTSSRSSTQGSTMWHEDISAFSPKKCRAWFNEYASKSSEATIDPEGMEKFCEDIGVEPENIVMLAIAYKLNASQMGYFTLEEWLCGMTHLQCDSTAKLINKLDYLRNLVNDQASFKPIYRYAFDFAKESGTRGMMIDVALPMLQLLLGKSWSLYSHFCRFIEYSNYKVLNRDQWLNIYEFSLQIYPDLSNYDEDGAWPVMLDEFVNWMRENELHVKESVTL